MKIAVEKHKREQKKCAMLWANLKPCMWSWSSPGDILPANGGALRLPAIGAFPDEGLGFDDTPDTTSTYKTRTALDYHAGSHANIKTVRLESRCFLQLAEYAGPTLLGLYHCKIWTWLVFEFPRQTPYIRCCSSFLLTWMETREEKKFYAKPKGIRRKKKNCE